MLRIAAHIGLTMPYRMPRRKPGTGPKGSASAYSEENSKPSLSLRFCERNIDPAGHGSMSNTEQLKATCRTCKVPSLHPLFCDSCFDQWQAKTTASQVKHEEERAARIALYANKPKMSPIEWAAFLAYFDIAAMKSIYHLQFFTASYWQWGCELPFDARLTDHDDLYHAVNLFSSQGPGMEDDYAAN